MDETDVHDEFRRHGRASDRYCSPSRPSRTPPGPSLERRGNRCTSPAREPLSGGLGAASGSACKPDVLEEGLVGCGPPRTEALRIGERRRPLRGVIVLDLVVVPRRERRHLGVEPLEIWIHAVLRVPVAIGRQRRRLDVVAVAPDRRTDSVHVLVDVVAEEEHEIRLFVGQMAVGGEEPVLVVGAGHEREPEPPQGGRGSGPVQVRPIRLCASPWVNRYQYGRSAARPLTSRWTEYA